MEPTTGTEQVDPQRRPGWQIGLVLDAGPVTARQVSALASWRFESTRDGVRVDGMSVVVDAEGTVRADVGVTGPIELIGGFQPTGMSPELTSALQGFVSSYADANGLAATVISTRRQMPVFDLRRPTGAPTSPVPVPRPDPSRSSSPRR